VIAYPGGPAIVIVGLDGRPLAVLAVPCGMTATPPTGSRGELERGERWARDRAIFSSSSGFHLRPAEAAAGTKPPIEIVYSVIRESLLENDR